MSLPCVRGDGLLSEGLPRQQDGGIVEPTARNEGSLRSHSTPCFNLMFLLLQTFFHPFSAMNAAIAAKSASPAAAV